MFHSWEILDIHQGLCGLNEKLRNVCSLHVQGSKGNQCQSPKFPDLNELDLKETHSLTKTNLPCSGIWKSLSQPDRRSPKQHRFSGCFCWWKKILHKLIGSLSHGLQGFIPPKVEQDFIHQRYVFYSKNEDPPTAKSAATASTPTTIRHHHPWPADLLKVTHLGKTRAMIDPS